MWPVHKDVGSVKENHAGLVEPNFVPLDKKFYRHRDFQSTAALAAW